MMTPRLLTLLMATGIVCAAPLSASAIAVYSSSGSNAASIQGSVDGFRADLGTNNLANAPATGGRREINWDGVPAGFSDPNHLPGNFFNSNSPRGAVFETPGSGFKVSANTGVGTPERFGSINPSFPSSFSVFSSQKLFTAIDSNIVDVKFFVPGTTQAANVRGFGSVFTDVDLLGPTTVEFFDMNNNLLSKQTVLNTPGATSLSFLGVSLEQAIINRVRITAGNAALSNLDGFDFVAMDDFIYGEPQAVPAPAAVLLLASGLAALVWARRNSLLPE
ncbi:MAG: hypothetical protein KF854_11375 [Nitrospira sp.]|nr:hypothetical protein [Nitrospira sp.]MBX3340111.1 hypothetical protein [Nitrospira sp.]MBX3369768.1 hypothetical protein [Nitrospira sp.]MBX7039568.1 hypothetical protein [Nitrospira sp.]MCW5793712.1 hypothetical protein [Nitrospira sp.]